MKSEMGKQEWGKMKGMLVWINEKTEGRRGREKTQLEINIWWWPWWQMTTINLT